MTTKLKIEEYWQERIDNKRDPNSIRIAGTQYWLGDEDTKCERGFGGQYHKIKKTTGRVIETTNLWYNGTIPAEIKHLLPDNAEFVND